MEDFYETAGRRRQALRRSGPAGRGRRLHRVQERWPCRRRCRSKGSKPMRDAEACVAAMREAVGDGIDIMVDCHARPSPRDGPAVRQGARTVRPVLLRRAVLARERRRAGDDQRGGHHADRDRRARDEPRARSAICSNARACEVCQLDITHCGGFTEARRIAALAEAYRIALAPHNPQGPVSTAASLEFGFSQPSYIICETVHADVPWRQDVVQEGFTVEPKRPHRAPEHAARPGHHDQRGRSEEASVPAGACRSGSFYRDGSVGDW